MTITNYRPVLVLAPGIMAGAEKVVVTGIVALSEIGLNPLMIIIRETRSPESAEVFNEALPKHIERKIINSTKAFDLSLPQRLKNVLKNEALPVIIHSHGFKALIACYLARGLSPHIHTHHGNTAHTFKVRIYEKLAMLTMKRCHQVIAVSTHMKDELQTLLNPYQNIMTVENMLSLDNAKIIRTKRANRPVSRSEQVQLIYIGRLSPEKGLLPFLKCFQKFYLKHKFHLQVLGDGAERPLIEKFINDHALASLVTLHGHVTNPAAFLTNPDVLIMPSLREGLPMTLIEAKASGLPVIANKVGAIASLVTQEHDGYVTPDFSEDSWNKALESTLKFYPDWKKNALASAETFETRFSVKEWARKTQVIYQSNLQ